MDRAQRCAETPRPRLALVAVGEAKRSEMCDQSRCASDRATARPVVWNRDRTQRVADQGGCDELPTPGQDRGRAAGKAKVDSAGSLSSAKLHGRQAVRPYEVNTFLFAA